MKKTQGFTLFIALTITATLLLVATGIVTVALRQSFLTGSSRESQFAFYAADTGIECALYWDVKNVTGNYSAFATSSPSSTTINCNQDPNNSSNPTNYPGGATPTYGGDPNKTVSTFKITFLPKPYCAVVTVTKNNGNTTNIRSDGFNTCDTINPRRTERSVTVAY